MACEKTIPYHIRVGYVHFTRKDLHFVLLFRPTTMQFSKADLLHYFVRLSNSSSELDLSNLSLPFVMPAFIPPPYMPGRRQPDGETVIAARSGNFTTTEDLLDYIDYEQVHRVSDVRSRCSPKGNM